MYTIFYAKAEALVNASKIDLQNKNYLSSWSKSLPARVNFIADMIVNLIFIPINGLSVFFALIKTLYTWGNEKRDLEKSVFDLTQNLNHILSDMTGLISINTGVSLRNEKNFNYLINGLSIACSLALVILGISKADGMTLNFDTDKGFFYPEFHYKFH